VARALETVSLADLGARYPAQLSGGQQQRVAIARVLVLEPRVLLLDEPFNALDAKLRGAMQVDLRKLIKRLGMTAIFVTHDQEEALTMSDRIAVMRAGRIEQVAPPEEVFDRPATAYVADFIGSSNFWDGEARAGRIALPDGQTIPAAQDGAVRLMARPHNIRIAPGGAGPWCGTVRFQRSIGALVEYEVATGAADIRVLAMRAERARALSEGAAVTLSVIDPALLSVYPAT
jgi:ABC-type Fe3+/spermidine/putrescine transport system ATPase subunit